MMSKKDISKWTIFGIVAAIIFYFDFPPYIGFHLALFSGIILRMII